MKEILEIFLQNPNLFLLGLVLIGSYFFFKKKFENLADKDDVSDLTREVENVKKEFNEDLEKLKVNLEILKSHKVNLVNEKRKTIYDFWSSMNLLIEKSINIFNYNIDDFDSYNQFKGDINKLYENFTLNRYSFELKLHEFIDEEFKRVIGDFSKLIIKKHLLLYEIGLEIVDFKFKLKKDEVEMSYYDSILDKYSKSSETYMDELYPKLQLIKEKLILITESLHK